MQIGTVDTQMIGNILNRDWITVVIFDILQGILCVAGFLLADGGLNVGKLLCQQEQIFIEDAVHDQVAVLRQLVGFRHFLMAAPQLFILPERNYQAVEKRSPFQIPLDLNALHPDPCVCPGRVLIGFIVDQLVRADQEGVTFLQTEQFPAGFVNARTLLDVMDQIAFAHDRAVAVAGGTVFIAAGVDHGVDILIEIIGEVVIQHHICLISDVAYYNTLCIVPFQPHRWNMIRRFPSCFTDRLSIYAYMDSMS